MSSTSYTSLSEHCNSIPSSHSQSVIHSESLLNMLVDQIDHLEAEQITNAFITHSSQLHSFHFLVSTLLSKMFDGDRDLPAMTSGSCVIKGRVITGLWNSGGDLS